MNSVSKTPLIWQAPFSVPDEDATLVGLVWRAEAFDKLLAA